MHGISSQYVDGLEIRVKELEAENDRLKAAQEVIETLKLSDNEGTRDPWWVIIDPVQNMRCDVFVAASQVTGPFFSRTDAQDHLKNRKYAFSPRAVVYCHSGCWSKKYSDMYQSIAKHQEAK